MSVPPHSPDAPSSTPRKPLPRPAGAGFTLVEIMIAAVLLFSLGSLIVMGLSASRRSQSQTYSIVSSQTSVRTLTNTITNDLEKTSFNNTVSPPGVLETPSASLGNGAILELIDGTRVTYYLDDDSNTVHRQTSSSNRAVANQIENLSFTASLGRKTIEVTMVPLANEAGEGENANATRYSLTHYVRNP